MHVPPFNADLQKMNVQSYIEGLRSKYNAKKTTIDGITFDSKKEAAYYRGLLLRGKAGEIKEFKNQVRFELIPKFRKNGVTHRAAHYVADFVVEYSDGRTEVIDVKGMRTALYKLKRKMFEFRYPNLSITEV